jgi:hypothetical protein
MNIPTLVDVKMHMNLEGIDDFDHMLLNLLNAEIARASNMTGIDFCAEEMNAEIFKAVLMGVATGFDSRQDNSDGASNEAVNASIYTYRQHSKRPMF